MQERVNIFLIGVSNYDHLPRLKGPEKDIERLNELFAKDPLISIFNESQIKKVINPTSIELRKKLSEYAINITADRDILILYFSGHGVPLGTSDYGFCTKDTQLCDRNGLPLPVNLVRFSDIIQTLAAVKVDPVIIIDACYSGQAGESITRTLEDLKRQIQAETGSAYVLLCSCRKQEQTPDKNTGGPFSEILVNVAKAGKKDRKILREEFLTLQDLHKNIRAEADALLDIGSILVVGDTIAKFGFVKNKHFKARDEKLQRSHLKVLDLLWNNGNPQEKNLSDLRPLGDSEYTTYSKLSYSPAWGLIIKGGKGKPFHLTEKGIRFMKGEIKVPNIIRLSESENAWSKAPSGKLIDINALKSMF